MHCRPVAHVVCHPVGDLLASIHTIPIIAVCLSVLFVLSKLNDQIYTSYCLLFVLQNCKDFIGLLHNQCKILIILLILLEDSY